MPVFCVGTFYWAHSLLLTPYLGVWFAYSTVPQCYYHYASLLYNTDTLMTHLSHSSINANLFCFLVLLWPSLTPEYLPVSLAHFSLSSSFLPSSWLVIYFISHIIMYSCCLDTAGMSCHTGDMARTGLHACAALAAAHTHSKHYRHHSMHTNWLHFLFCFGPQLGLH